MNSLFIEASAKTAVGVHEAFQEVVEKILETPELWAPVTPDKGKRGVGGEMPGTIDLNSQNPENTADGGSGCSC
jgi:Ras-related protein Rab-18